MSEQKPFKTVRVAEVIEGSAPRATPGVGTVGGLSLGSPAASASWTEELQNAAPGRSPHTKGSPTFVRRCPTYVGQLRFSQCILNIWTGQVTSLDTKKQSPLARPQLFRRQTSVCAVPCSFARDAPQSSSRTLEVPARTQGGRQRSDGQHGELP